MSFVGKSEIVGWGMILIARSAALSAISLPVIPMGYVRQYPHKLDV